MVPRWLRSGWRVPARCSGSLKRVVVKRATLWLAGFGSEFGRDGCYFRPLAQAALASKTRSAVAVGLIMSHTWAISGPLRSASAGHRAITLGECRSSTVSRERTGMTQWPPGGATVATFQAGHASSILVTRSR
jgi:hypothetical protein